MIKLQRKHSTAPLLLFIALAYSLVPALKLYPDLNITRLITAGDAFVNPQQTPSEIRVLEDSDGYDGQFYYRLALDPFTRETTAYGVTLDHPAFRQQRIGYPLAAWALSLGNPSLVPVMLVLVNILAAAALGAMGIQLAMERGKPAIVGLLFAFYPGFAYSHFRDLAEILTAALLLAGILHALRDRHWLAAWFLAAAVATRETALLVPAAFGMVQLYLYLASKPQRPAHWWYAYLLPLVVYLALRAAMGLNWGTDSLSGGIGDLGPPLVGIAQFLGANHPLETPLQTINMIGFLFCAVTTALAALSLRTSQAQAAIKLAWLLYLLLIISLSNVLWLTLIEFARAFNEFWLLSCLALIHSDIPRQGLIAILVVGLWLGLFLGSPIF